MFQYSKRLLISLCLSAAAYLFYMAEPEQLILPMRYALIMSDIPDMSEAAGNETYALR